MVANQSKETSAPKAFSISRLFDAPRERVWKAWTEAAQLKQWWGPKGFSVHTCRVDLRPGGVFHYGMRMPDGGDMWGRFVYRRIDAPRQLEFIVTFSDPGGGVIRHPWSPTWPLEMLSTVSLDDRADKTEVSVKWLPHNATEVERRTFDEGHESMQQGWSGTFDQFADYLART